MSEYQSRPCHEDCYHDGLPTQHWHKLTVRQRIWRWIVKTFLWGGEE